jgi:hypothetical protein
MDAHRDSWGVMRMALKALDEAHDQSLYSVLFFEQKVKFIYPPTSLLLLDALRNFPSRNLATDFVLNTLSWLALAATAGIVARIFVIGIRHHLGSLGESLLEKTMQWVLPICFTLTFYPLVRSFHLGQIQTWIVFLFSAAVLAWMTGYKGMSGALSAFICVIKPQLGLLILWGLIRKEWRFVTSWGLVVTVVAILSLWTYGLDNHLDYLKVLSYISNYGESYYPNQSINGLLNRLTFNGNAASWDNNHYPPYNSWVYIGTTISSLLIIGLALFWRKGEYQQAGLTDLSIAGLSFTMASPVAWEHHYGIMLPIYALALPLTLARWPSRNGMIWLIVSYVLASNLYLFTNLLAETPFNFSQSYLFFGAVLLLLHLYRLRSYEQQALGLELYFLENDANSTGYKMSN